MAPRSYWKGYLKLSLVTCPVSMMPAKTEAEKVRFHTLNAKTGNRVLSRYVDAISGKPVPWDPSMVDDPVQARLLDIIATRKKSPKRRVRTKAPEKADTDDVIDIMDALRKSIGAAKKKK